jgi:hypothetical protein
MISYTDVHFFAFLFFLLHISNYHRHVTCRYLLFSLSFLLFLLHYFLFKVHAQAQAQAQAMAQAQAAQAQAMAKQANIAPPGTTRDQHGNSLTGGIGELQLNLTIFFSCCVIF